ASQQWGQLFEGMYGILKKSRRFSHDDKVIECLNDLLLTSLRNPKKIDSVMRDFGLRSREQDHLKAHLSWYKIQDVAGPTVAYAYREFVSRNFTGKSYGLKKVGRYLTPAEVIKFMVSLCGVKPSDKVMDFACGSGGFLGEITSQISVQTNTGLAPFVRSNLFATDIDPFSVSTSRTFLSLLYPDLSDDFKVFRHNALYSENPKISKEHEDRLPDSINEGSFDLVVSNPPAYNKYSGTNPAFVRKKYKLDKMFWDVVPFLRRAISLVKPEGGRICVVVPDGFTANAHLKFLRDEVARQCQLRAIVSLPRIFKNNSAKMSILFMHRTKRKNFDRKVLLASIPLKGVTENGKEETVNINAEFDYILDEFKKMERQN
ncbi:MAG: SAM-dependent methyltransferase, partial [candidate division Zixibacteria bacterium]|nr:SAM-dependent methyltransferase [candidate division Zixibacteria bacterium]